MMNVSLEELYNIPTAEYVHRRAFVNRQLTVYHVALHACAELKNKEVFYCIYPIHLTIAPPISRSFSKN